MYQVTKDRLKTMTRGTCPVGLFLILAGAGSLGASSALASDANILGWHQNSDGITLKTTSGTLNLQVWASDIIRVRFSPTGDLSTRKSLSVIATPVKTVWHVKTTATDICLITGRLQADVDKESGAVRFLDPSGKVLLGEKEGTRALTPVTLAGTVPESAYQTEQDFTLGSGQSIYGLGQHQSGNMNTQNQQVLLEQTNREVAIPLMMSSAGYGLFWDNPSSTVFTDGNAGGTIPSSQLLSADGSPGGLTGQYYDGTDLTNLKATRIDPQVDFNWTSGPAAGLGHDEYSVRWTGYLQASRGGNYSISTQSDDGVRLWIDDKQVIDDWTVHATKTDNVVLHFDPNTRHSIKMEYFQDKFDAIARLQWIAPGTDDSHISWKSEAGDGIDYTVFYGPTLDHVMASYRDLTGQAPMFAQWALGLWQCKERYNTQQQWLDIAGEYRSRKEPLDNIVQDWFYWDPHLWGSHQFDQARYPDPAAAIKTLHDQDHVHFMISVWAKFKASTPTNDSANYDELNSKGLLYPTGLADAQFYDAFNPEARAVYWRQMHDEIFSKGVDGWWLDASEPELDLRGWRPVMTSSGLASRVLNAYPLMHTTSVYEGQRHSTDGLVPNQRVFILTRSAYAGQQRNAAATWSGDITGNWDVFAKQIPAGLNIGLSGIPYWTTDIGGFFPGYDGGNSNPVYRQLFTRWFQFGAFCPIFRVHGTGMDKELWRFGPDTEKVLVKYDNLRYRLMPYIYSDAWQVTSAGSTMMRAMVMDFPADTSVRDLTDEFMFGPSLLVCPVTQQDAVSRSVILPAGPSWTDFWTGQSIKGGRTINAPAPIETMPLYVKAGSIVPMGPYLQYTGEKPADPIELRVYPGANGKFTLYEDDRVTYEYEKEIYATIPITWNEQDRTLTIGARKGTFPGMLEHRTFRIVLVKPGHGAGLEPSEQADRIISYTGNAVVSKL